jgi:glycine/serine hydroxymethyltransferase
MGKDEVKIVVDLMDRVITNSEDKNVISSVKSEVKKLCKSFPIYD